METDKSHKVNRSRPSSSVKHTKHTVPSCHILRVGTQHENTGPSPLWGGPRGPQAVGRSLPQKATALPVVIHQFLGPLNLYKFSLQNLSPQKHCNKRKVCAPASVAQLGIVPQTKKLPVRLPVKAQAWGAGLVPG